MEDFPESICLLRRERPLGHLKIRRSGQVNASQRWMGTSVFAEGNHMEPCAVLLKRREKLLNPAGASIRSPTILLCLRPAPEFLAVVAHHDDPLPIGGS